MNYPNANLTVPMPRRRGRPPKSEKGYSATREALLQAGIEILTEKGFSSTGIEEILSKVGVPKGSFYHFFDSKEAFGIALVDKYADYFAYKLNKLFSDDSKTPIERLKTFVELAKLSMHKYNYARGCLIGNLGQEMGNLQDSFRIKLSSVFLDWQYRLAECLELAKQQGEIPANSDCHRLANCFWVGWEGAVLRAKLEKSCEPLDVFADFFFAGLTSK